MPTTSSSKDLRAYELLGESGPLAQELEGFKPRVAQQELAQAIEHAIENRGQLIAEAGTGTGKTYAYLTPALRSGKKVLVSTGTKTLQDQLFHRDLPKLRRVLGLETVKIALLKGRQNYICLHRLDRTIKEGRLASRELVTQLARVREWAPKTRSGDRAEVPGLPEDAPIWPLVTSNADNCLGPECAFWEECYVVKARRRAQSADLVVVNHHLLFSDMAVRREGFGEVLPGAQVYVLDEAHQLAESATSFFSTSISLRQLVELGRDALAECHGGVGSAKSSSDKKADGEKSAKAVVAGAYALLKDPVQAVEYAAKDMRIALTPYAAKAALEPVLAEPEVAAKVLVLNEKLEELCEVLQQQAERSDGLESCAARALDLATRFKLLTSEKSPEASVRWYELYTNSFVFHSTPLDVAGPLAEFRERSGAAWVYTSATLAVGKSFQHFQHEVGAFNAETLLLDSPFDFQQQALLYLPKLPMEPNAEGYTLAVLDCAVEVLKASKGRAFILFTSHRALQEAARVLPSRVPFPLFVQGQGPRAQLLQEFEKSGNGVLLGAASFWEGVDVPGDALSVVIIDKLPFGQIGDPVLEAKLDAVRERGGNPFAHYQLPNAVIALKQGVGRLIRTVHDRGVLVLCDPRLQSKSYGRTFLQSLPAMARTSTVEDVQAFFAVKSEP